MNLHNCKFDHPETIPTYYKDPEWSANPGLIFILFLPFQTHIKIFTTNKCENVHPVYGAGIRIHDLWNMRLLP